MATNPNYNNSQKKEQDTIKAFAFLFGLSAPDNARKEYDRKVESLVLGERSEATSADQTTAPTK